MRHTLYPAIGVYMAPDPAPWGGWPLAPDPTPVPYIVTVPVPTPVPHISIHMPSLTEADIRRIIREELERLKAEEGKP